MIATISSDIGYLDLTSARSRRQQKITNWFYPMTRIGPPKDIEWSCGGVAEALKVETKRELMAQSLGYEKDKEEMFLSRDAIMIHNVDGTIRYWSGGAQKLYGWEAQDVLGKISHRLLETVFPAPLEAIEEELRTKGYWEGQLIHTRREGQRLKS